MTEKRFDFKRFDVDVENINEIALYEIDNNPSDDLDESNLFYVYSTTNANVQSIVDKLNNQEEIIQELYDFRLIYNALLFNEWSKHDVIEVYKSKKHSDGELCFNGEWFVVVAILPDGQITNHYHIKYWNYFQIKEYPQVKDEFDGHTSIDVLNRLKSMVM